MKDQVKESDTLKICRTAVCYYDRRSELVKTRSLQEQAKSVSWQPVELMLDMASDCGEGSFRVESFGV